MKASNSTKPIYSFELEFERCFPIKSTHEWMSHNWNTAFYWITIYLIIIFGGKTLMKNREPYRLRSLLFLWNLFLAIFSIVGTFRIFPEIIDILREQGFKASVCNNRIMTEIQVSNTWTFLFTLSKVLELIDTVFIVLRKQNLIFLHWYHHLTVLAFSWFAYSQLSSTARWYVSVNFSIHAVMYSYYAIRAMNISVPKGIAKLITSSQIIQMVFGIFVTSYAFIQKLNGNQCMTSYGVLYWAFAIYSSYFLLFVNFFINSYIKRSKRNQIKKD